MTRQREVQQFAIMAPAARRAVFIAAGERFEEWMCSAFPGKDFLLVEPARGICEEGETLVVPVMGSVGDNFGDSRICRPADPREVQAIADRVAAFDATAGVN